MKQKITEIKDMIENLNDFFQKESIKKAYEINNEITENKQLINDLGCKSCKEKCNEYIKLEIANIEKQCEIDILVFISNNC